MDSIKFLGTAGARFVMMKQLRASGGTWLNLSETNILIDPGPGTLVKCWRSRPKLDPSRLDAIVLSHKHLDHSGDINVMIEAMTNGGFKKRGLVFAPRDALEEDPVILHYLRDYPERIEVLKEGGKYQIGPVTLKIPKRHQHSVETYGLNFCAEKRSISFVTDTFFFPELSKFYPGEVLVINVVRLKKDARKDIQHLSLEEAKRIIAEARPKLAVLTHFGMTVIKAKPWELAEKIEEQLGTKVVAARDGMSINLDEV
jgi:phosphoribosyl 1,2-cyclic phosphodiesterase